MRASDIMTTEPVTVTPDEPIVVSMVRDVAGVIDVVSHLHQREPNPRVPSESWMFGAR